jgi:hypothetical protein
MIYSVYHCVYVLASHVLANMWALINTTDWCWDLFHLHQHPLFPNCRYHDHANACCIQDFGACSGLSLTIVSSNTSYHSSLRLILTWWSHEAGAATRLTSFPILCVSVLLFWFGCPLFFHLLLLPGLYGASPPSCSAFQVAFCLSHFFVSTFHHFHHDIPTASPYCYQQLPCPPVSFRCSCWSSYVCVIITVLMLSTRSSPPISSSVVFMRLKGLSKLWSDHSLLLPKERQCARLLTTVFWPPNPSAQIEC